MDTQAPHLTPMYHPASHIVYAASGADVRHVLVDGRLLVRDRQLTDMDINAVMAQVNRIARDIRETQAG